MSKPLELWAPDVDAIAGVRAAAPALVREFFTAGRAACRRETTLTELHEFRLAAKRFRYSLELLQPLYGASFERRLKSLQKLQSLLGDVNDCVATGELLDGDPYASLAGTSGLRRWLDREAKARTAAFRTQWAERFDAPGEEQRWVDYLVRFAGRTGKR